MTNVFTYHRTLNDRTIRLLKVMLEPESRTLTIQLVEKLLDQVDFDALSYVWGSQMERIPIKCNGKRLDIGVNLHAALHERRRRRCTKPLWADQICINQEDIEEKTSQVRMMRDIYATADRVIVWLGEQQPEDIDGLHLVERLYEKCGGKQYDADAGIYDFHDFDCEAREIPRPFFNPKWAAVFKLIGNPWFGRIWVIQELLVAGRSVVWKGSLNMDTNAILWVAILVGRHRNLYNSYGIVMGSPKYSVLMARNIAESYYRFKKTGPGAIYDVLSRNLGMGATDFRDRVFALAGVSLGLDQAFIDYRRTFREVACLVGKMTLLGFPNYRLNKEGNELLILKDNINEHRFPIEWLAFHANPQNHELGIPSWVPDLFSPHSPGLLMTGFYDTMYLRESRDLPKPRVRLGKQLYSMPEPSLDYWQICVPDEIEIEGAIFDCVRVVARNRPSLPLPSPSLKNCNDTWTAFEAVSKYETEMVYWLSDIRLLADPSLDCKGSIMDGPSFDAFWRTLLYNRGPRFDYSSPNQQVEGNLAVTFGYWYLWKKFQMQRRWQDGSLIWAVHDKMLAKLAEPFEEAEGRVRHARNFFVSQRGRIGWVPFRTSVGDQVCVLQGMRIPLILRPQGNRWEVIGACYVHELMDGQLWDLDCLQWKFMKFV
ncbi:heterokaryon incompatibility protein-domain-containing protein [Lophiotrema nucula]|uniref:Heterokaryon incompatibility protein-domain-containing protein n=1 Tax=Lophiotrema nucula TaxID=690887 RepID=A0A6A5YNX1_9PLEO|nr:heterokaryon incompatibility protein-domain-containing protein [Lophiotrema nucula]